VLDGLPTIILICPARLARELLTTYLSAAAEDVRIRCVDSLPCTADLQIDNKAVIAFVDVGYPREQLLEDIRRTRRALPDNSMALLSDYGDRYLAARALALGVKGLICTSMCIAALVPSMRILLAGGEIMPPTLLMEPGSNANSLSGIRNTLELIKPNLSQPERDVLCLLGKGKPNKLIAAQLELDESVVKNCIRGLMRKTGARNRVELALYFAHSPVL
jgi:DNA-binding NarL/FixJ family response regulator